MLFHFKAQKANGEVFEGEKDAPDKFILFDDLKKDGATMLFARPLKGDRHGLKWDKLYRLVFGSVPIHQKIIFAKNLAAMIEAGLPLSRSLAVIERQTGNREMKKIVADVNESIKKGATLSDSLARYPGVFSSLFVSIVRAGEESGSLSNALRTVHSQLERIYYLQRKIRGALIYPAVVISLIIVVGILMFTLVIPKLTATFSDLKVQLPWSTRLLIGISELFRDHYIVLIIGAVTTAFFVWSLFQTRLGKKFFDTAFIKFPILGAMVVETNAARAARTLASLLSSGVNVVEAIQITSEVVQNTRFREVLDKAKEAIQKGAPLSKVFGENEKIYPAFFTEMVEAGEETGNLSGMLGDVAQFYENEVDDKTKDFSTVIEPLIMIFIGSAVGFFALAMLTPMYSMMGSIQ